MVTYRARSSTRTPTSTSKRKHAVTGMVGAGLACLMVAVPLTAGAAGASSAPWPYGFGQPVSKLALGVNVAPWDSIYTTAGGAGVVNPDLQAAGVGLLRYGGGSYADYYDWATNSDIQNCLPDDTTAPYVGATCDSTDALDFDNFSANARSIGAASFVTVNYGSGNPAEAAGYVQHALSTSGDNVTMWEVGNENYGCWEVNNWLSQYPENYAGYTPNTYTSVNGVYENPTCPDVTQGDAAGTQTLATSYAVNALPFMVAMKDVSPQADIGVPWAFGNDVPGAAVADNSEWNDTVLGQDGRDIGFVDAHYYPFEFSGSPSANGVSDQQVLQSLTSVPSLYNEIRSGLDKYDPKAAVIVGETNISNNPTTANCTPVGALFAAGDVLSWLSAGAETVDWWDMNNYGGTAPNYDCTNPAGGSDYGMFTSTYGAPAPLPPLYGYEMASVLAKPGAELGTMQTSSSDVLAFQSVGSGGHAVAFINTNTSSAETVTWHSVVPFTGQLKSEVYSQANPVITSSQVSASSVAHSITLPAESMVVLSQP